MDHRIPSQFFIPLMHHTNEQSSSPTLTRRFDGLLARLWPAVLSKPGKTASAWIVVTFIVAVSIVTSLALTREDPRLFSAGDATASGAGVQINGPNNAPVRTGIPPGDLPAILASSERFKLWSENVDDLANALSGQWALVDALFKHLPILERNASSEDEQDRSAARQGLLDILQNLGTTAGAHSLVLARARAPGGSDFTTKVSERILALQRGLNGFPATVTSPKAMVKKAIVQLPQIAENAGRIIEACLGSYVDLEREKFHLSPSRWKPVLSREDIRIMLGRRKVD